MSLVCDVCASITFDYSRLSESNGMKKLEDFVPKLGSKYAMDWDDYHDHNTLNDFIAALADANDFASIIPIGESYEGRKMNVLAITKAGPGAPNIWLEAGIHAREWISPAVATFIVRELVEDYAEHPSYIDNINWYFLPSGTVAGCWSIKLMTPLILSQPRWVRVLPQPGPLLEEEQGTKPGKQLLRNRSEQELGFPLGGDWGQL